MKNKLEELNETIILWEQSTAPCGVYDVGVVNGLLLAKSVITGCEFHPHDCTPNVNAKSLVDEFPKQQEMRCENADS